MKHFLPILLSLAALSASAAGGDALNGRFSVSATRQIQFAPGNLQYDCATGNWLFAEHQYDVIGEKPIGSGNTNYGMNVPGYTGKLDLFGWSCTSIPGGANPSNRDADYTGAFVDWGTLTGGEWRTPSYDEFQYLLARKDAANRPLWSHIALILNTTETLKGLMLMPDDWVQPDGTTLEYGYYTDDVELDYDQNNFTLAQWNVFEQAGAVFLPYGGTRVGGFGNKYNGAAEATMYLDANGDYFHVDNTGFYGYYWLCTQDSRSGKEHCAYYLITPGWSDNTEKNYPPAIWSREKRRGNSVRLVKDYYAPDATLYGLGTFVNAKNVVHVSNGSFYRIYQGSTNEVVFTSIDAGTLDAGTPVLFKADDADGMVLTFGNEEITVDVDNPISLNGFVGLLNTASANLPVSREHHTAALINAEGNLVYAADNFTLAKGHAYIDLTAVSSTPSGAPGRRMFRAGNGHAPTGLNDSGTDESVTCKTLEGNRLIIIKNGKKFDVTGQRVR